MFELAFSPGPPVLYKVCHYESMRHWSGVVVANPTCEPGASVSKTRSGTLLDRQEHCRGNPKPMNFLRCFVSWNEIFALKKGWPNAERVRKKTMIMVHVPSLLPVCLSTKQDDQFGLQVLGCKFYPCCGFNVETKTKTFLSHH